VSGAANPAAGSTAQRRAPAARRRLVPLVAAVWGAAAAGVVLATLALTGDEPATTAERAAATPQAAAPAAPAPTGGVRGLGDRIAMSFGSASVGSVVNVTGPREVMGLRVRPGERVFQAQVTVVNLRERPITFAPSQLTLTPRRAVGDVTVATGSAEGGRIPARSPHRFAVRFTLARTGALPDLRIGDPGTSRRTTVALGSTSGLETLDLGEHHLPPSPTGGRGR
jgi:hypothetical protein